MLVERLEILEDLGETLPPDAGCLIRILGCRPTERVIILGTHRQRFSALGMDQATVSHLRPTRGLGGVRTRLIDKCQLGSPRTSRIAARFHLVDVSVPHCLAVTIARKSRWSEG